jgi:hypothetical protein
LKAIPRLFTVFPVLLQEEEEKGVSTEPCWGALRRVGVLFQSMKRDVADMLLWSHSCHACEPPSDWCPGDKEMMRQRAGALALFWVGGEEEGGAGSWQDIGL